MNSVIVILLAFLFFAIIVAAMAIGVIFRGKCIRGSCGGQAIYGPEGELLNCDSCPVRREREDSSSEKSEGTRISASD